MIAKTLSAYRNAYMGLSRETWLLSLVMLINRSGTMVVPFLSLYMTSAGMGYSIGQAGIVFGCFGAGAFSGAYFFGILTDKIGFYKVQLITLFGGAILFIILGQMKSLYLICMVTFLLSFVNEGFRPANSTAIAYYSSPENRTRSYSLNRLAINLGWAVGAGLGGLIASYSYALLFWIDGLTNLIAGILMWQFLNAAGTEARRKTMELQEPVNVQPAYKDWTYIYFIILVTLFASCFFQIFTTVSVYMKKELHFSEPFIGILMSLNGVLIVLVEMVLVYRLEGRKNSLIFISMGVGLVALFFLLLGFGSSYLVFIFLIAILTFGEMLSMPFMNNYWTGRSSPGNRGQYAALYTMAWSAAQTFGPMLSAQMAEHAGFRATWIADASICILVSIVFWQLKANQVDALPSASQLT